MRIFLEPVSCKRGLSLVKQKDRFHLVNHNQKNMHKNGEAHDNFGKISHNDNNGNPMILPQENELFSTFCRLCQGPIEDDLYQIA